MIMPTTRSVASGHSDSVILARDGNHFLFGVIHALIKFCRVATRFHGFERVTERGDVICYGLLELGWRVTWVDGFQPGQELLCSLGSRRTLLHFADCSAALLLNIPR